MLKSKVKFERFNKLKTRTNITFSTQEDIDDLDLAIMIGTEGDVVFNGQPFNKKVEQVMKDRSFGPKFEGRSHSQIVRGLIFQAWSNGKLPYETGEEAYDAEMKNIEYWLRKKYS